MQLKSTRENAENATEQVETVIWPEYDKMDVSMVRHTQEQEKQKVMLQAQLGDLKGEVKTISEQIVNAYAHIEKLEDILSKRAQRQ